MYEISIDLYHYACMVGNILFTYMGCFLEEYYYIVVDDIQLEQHQQNQEWGQHQNHNVPLFHGHQGDLCLQIKCRAQFCFRFANDSL